MSAITVSKRPIKIGKEPVVILPFKKWKEIETELEDLKMYRSLGLLEEIAKRRKEKTEISLDKILRKYRF